MGFPGILLTTWFIFVQLFLFTSFSSSRLVANEVDRLSLLAFKAEITNDTLGTLSSWNASLHFCQWPGITCGRRHKRVTVLDLQSSRMVGSLSPHIGNLSFLRELNLPNNSFSGTIPPEIGRLFRLQLLHLQNNSFSGHIPFNVSRCSNLRYLALSGNALSGELSTEIGSLAKLQVLLLGRNRFSGKIPSSFGNLSSLQVLSAAQNNLQGGIPNRLGQLKSLTFISLGPNDLTGTIPPSIYNLSSITIISVVQNQLHGTLPPGLGRTIFPNLEDFRFQFNQFTGPIPTTISNASNLAIFGISENKFTGRIPSLARMSNLSRLEIDDNNLGNNEKGDLDFLSSLVNCTNLEYLDISSNNFGGVLPESVSNLSMKLEAMRMSRNQIRGSIPPEIGNFVNLGNLDFGENLLRGPIPSSISKLDKLVYLYLDHNELSGTIPPSIGNLSSLETLNLTFNFLQGRTPRSLVNCWRLIFLHLSQNYLSGPIPLQVLSSLTHVVVLDLSRNQLTGSIPLQVGSMGSLEILDLSGNVLSGEVPGSLGTCTGLRSLHLRGNLFQGTIPQSLKSLRGIENLDLSCNNLSGTIPNYMGSFRFLQNLNLSHNDLEGAVPTEGIFTNRSAFYIKGNRRLCGGIPELQLPICNSSNSNNKQDIFPWRKVLISIACGSGIGVILLLCFILLYPAKKALCFVLLYLSSKARSKLTLGSSWEVSLLKVSYRDLLEATNGFSSRNLIGAGGFGSVYRGILDQEERIVAVKVLSAHRSRDSFMVECETLKNIRHRNLVKLLTVCVSIDFQGNDFIGLVYEFMVNGNLEEWLHFSAHRLPGAPIVQGHLNLTQRVNIAIDIANALNYLHNHSHMSIVHCDLKPSNVLLEGDMTARVADFGLARYLPDASCSLPSHRSTANVINGSIGYIAPGQMHCCFNLFL